LTAAAHASRSRSLDPTIVLPALVLLASLGVIGGALAFQHWGGLVPCELCLAERWPWYAAIPLAALGLAWRAPPVGRLMPAVFLLLFLGSAGLAFYHVGVEQHVFAGPTACTAGKLTGSIEEMKRQLLGTPAVLCDEVQWSLFGISLAGFNLILSIALAGAAGWAWRHIRRGETP
jgi:disulfide bond formation protein DsbB